MASSAEQGLAKKLLSQRRSGHVSNDLASSARRVLDGQERAGDMDAIRAHFGVGRSHVRGVRGVTRTTTRLAGTAMNISRDMDLLASGSSSAGARMIATLGIDVSQEIVRNRRTLIKLGEGVAKTVGADPALASKFFNSLSRIAKVGGAVTTAAVAAFMIANKWFETLKAGGEAGRKMSEAFFTSGSRAKAMELQSSAQGQIARESLLGPNTGIAFIDELFAARQLSASAKRMSEMQARTNQAREIARPLAGQALARYAGQRGKSIDDLTPEEVNTVLDQEAKRHVGISMDKFTDYTDTKKAELVWWERQLMAVSPHYNASKLNQWAQELQQRNQDRKIRYREARARAEDETMRRMTSTDRLALKQAREEATAGWSAYRSRHRAVILD